MLVLSLRPAQIRKRNRTAGFTLLELLVATSIFAIILLVVTAGILSFTRQYYRGVVSSATQTTARAVMSEVTQAIQFASTIQPNLAGNTGFCVDNKLYSYKVNQQVTDGGGTASLHQGYHALVRSPLPGGCSATTAPLAMPNSATLPSGQRELLGNHMRLAVLEIKQIGTGPLYSVHVRVVYGDDDLLTDLSDLPNLNCKGGIGTQFCAVSDLTTTVQKRMQ